MLQKKRKLDAKVSETEQKKARLQYLNLRLEPERHDKATEDKINMWKMERKLISMELKQIAEEKEALRKVRML